MAWAGVRQKVELGQDTRHDAWHRRIWEGAAGRQDSHVLWEDDVVDSRDGERQRSARRIVEPHGRQKWLQAKAVRAACVRLKSFAVPGGFPCPASSLRPVA